jgi:hypothetical protein
MFGAFPRPKLSFRGAAGPCRTRTRNLSMGVSNRAKHVGIPGSHCSGFAAFVRPGMTSGSLTCLRQRPPHLSQLLLTTAAQ